MNKLSKLAYVGAKLDGETAFHDLTGGITWYPRSVHAVDAKHASRMLQHPDVFAQAPAEAELCDGFPGGHPDDLPKSVAFVAPVAPRSMADRLAAQNLDEGSDNVDTLIPSGDTEPQVNTAATEDTGDAEISLAPGATVAAAAPAAKQAKAASRKAK